MIKYFSKYLSKPVSIVLLLAFYLQTILPVVALAGIRNMAGKIRSYNISSRLVISRNAGFSNVTFSNPAKNINVGTKAIKDLNLKSPKKVALGGPGQPEMATFKSVNTGNMVDLFTGDFSYNIPLLDVGGYPVNIHYNGGITMDQEASWVGLGWNINPGVVSRNMRGLPDDFNGDDKITRTQKIFENKTVGASIGGDLELFGGPVNVGIKLGLFNNSYNGWGTETGVNASVNLGGSEQGNNTGSQTLPKKNDSSYVSGAVTLGLSATNNSQTGLSISPSISVRLLGAENANNGTVRIGSNYNSRAGITGLQLSTGFVHTNKTFRSANEGLFNSTNLNLGSNISFATPSYTPTITIPVTNSQYSFTLKLGVAIGPIHPNFFWDGYVSKQYVKDQDTRQTLSAYGYLYLTKGIKDTKGLLDFNREKEMPFNYQTSPLLALPQYTYDTYSITGEGVGGMFRPYRSEIGFITDHYVQTRSENTNGSIDLGLGPTYHFGQDYFKTNVVTVTQAWVGANAILPYLKFKSSDSSFREVYFRNPGEKAINSKGYYQSIGDEALMRVKLSGSEKNVTASNAFTTFNNLRPSGEVAINTSPIRSQRDKQSQVITYLTASEAASYSIDKSIKSYKENTIPYSNCNDTVTTIPRVDGTIRRKHHMSEIDVLNPDGRRYVYGIPAYNVEQDDVTFAVDKETNTANYDRGIASYTAGSENSIKNPKGKDHLFTKDSIPPFAHSFLLTEILSADYVDVNNDGVTDDDQGDAIKFNYSRVFGPEAGYYNWRTPNDKNKANYNEGLKTYSRDDKGTYLYGRKEVWYLNSIESKTMIAVFRVSSDRKDNYPVIDQNGGVDTSKPLRKLERIDLYAKSDLIRNGTNARPIKSIHFEYNYNLCPQVTNSKAGYGKLTLSAIWFSYNGNYKGKKNPYQFYYSPTDIVSNPNPKVAYNPTYNSKQYDRWGNYKDPSNRLGNPGGLNNVDFPYASQDSSFAAQYASAWHLTDIKLPSGGLLKITYEADDYGYVQNKRATRFFKITGFGSDSTSQPEKVLYHKLALGSKDNYYVFVDGPSTLQNKSDIYYRYLEGIKKVFFKVAVKMPTDRWGSGVEYVPTYAEIEDYGKVAGQSQRFWIRLKPFKGVSPITKAALQFLRLNLPSKAFPASELGDNVNLKDFAIMFFSAFANIKDAVLGFENAARSSLKCSQTDTGKSFVRLNAPDMKKLGGGARVKRVQLYDNWNKMTTQKESVYGQEYIYTTTEKKNGQTWTISSGVASYEPFIGNDENALREPIEYKESISPLGPSNDLYAETPLGESFYPAAMVGYSKVRVRTINTRARSANGWEESQFYTTKDFPTKVDFTPFDGDSKKRYNPLLKKFLKIDAVSYVAASQGFRIDLNDMNGKLKSQANSPENDSEHPIHYTENFYRLNQDTANKKVLSNKVWVVDSINGHIDTAGVIGKDIEVMTDFREQKTNTISQNISTNLFSLGPGFLSFIPIFTTIPLPQKEETRFRSVATVKIIQRYGILDSVVVIDKGSMVSTKNLVYDGETGEVLASRTKNEFNDHVYNFNYPAHWAYSGMGPAYKNIQYQASNKKIIEGKLFESDGTTASNTNNFESGDEIWITATEPLTRNYSGACVTYTYKNYDTSRKIWAIDVSKGKEKTQGMYFLDADGKPYVGIIKSMKIIRSGKRNMLDASVGSITSLANPIKEITTGNFRVSIDSTTRVVSAATSKFNDLWTVSDSYYAIDSTYTKYDTVSVVMNPSITRVKIRLDNTNPVNNTSTTYEQSSGNVIASMQYMNSAGTGSCTHDSYTWQTKTIMGFPISQIPSTASILTASLRMYTAPPVGNWGPEVFTYRNVCPGGTLLTDINYRWDTVTISKLNNYNSTIKRLTSNWSTSMSYADIASIASPTNLISIGTLGSASFFDFSCAGLVSDLVANPASNGNVVFTLNTENFTSPPVNYLSFNGTSNAPALSVTYRVLNTYTVKVCRKQIVDSAVNPYKTGIFGNWRMNRAYTYYNDRKENDASVGKTSIRKDGELAAFIPYWTFNDTALKATTDTNKWVWNSTLSKFNTKGLEVENYDPLGRVNAGLYGYNSSMPIAVGQNMRYRELLYDGFEDYDYNTKNCTYCTDSREYDFRKGNSNTSISATYSHTGKTSLKVNANTQAVVYFSPIYISADTIQPAVSMKVDSTPVYYTTVVGKGTGLSGAYQGYDARISGSCTAPFTPPYPYPLPRTDSMMCMGLPGYASLPPNTMCASKFSVDWTGTIQAPYTGTFRFYATSSGSMWVKVNNVMVANSPVQNIEQSNGSIDLVKGNLYSITVHFDNNPDQTPYIKLRWSCDQIMSVDLLPKRFIYPSASPDTSGSIVPGIQSYCTKLGNAKPQNVLRPKFSPIVGHEYLISWWVKLGATDCDTTNINVTTLDVGDNGTLDRTQSNFYYNVKAGPPIDGWQRYETYTYVKPNTTSLWLTLKGVMGKDTYFDDIRIQPFRSSAKSFVYDPVSLRLMAELDENNYATFYEYDDDGTLVRVKKETMKGVQTVKESRSALVKDE